MVSFLLKLLHKNIYSTVCVCERESVCAFACVCVSVLSLETREAGYFSLAEEMNHIPTVITAVKYQSPLNINHFLEWAGELPCLSLSEGCFHAAMD